ncbi:hypothetical protein BC832DRAFT_270928 [Gaertneriomyces semiglobifer]|nr:hypothetical protein BC832DRAFT_270928 [Gaertneriomyces semiglobifer]
MPKYTLSFRAELENVSTLRPENVEEYDWKIQFRCTKCDDVHEKFVSLVGTEEMGNSSNARSTANLVMRCKGCKNEGSSNLLPQTFKPYTDAVSSQYAPMVQIECRGLEPVAWEVADGWVATAESGATFSDIPLGNGEEWAEYDEKGSVPVGIVDIETGIDK